MKHIDIPTWLEEGVELPTYESQEAAGADVRAFIKQDITIEPGRGQLVPTGLRFEIPKGYEIQIRPRSGLALKYGITLLNTPGTIDSDYRGEVGVILINHGKKPFRVTPKMRIAQLVFAPVYQAGYRKVELLKTTKRGESGFGHTGTH